MLRQEAARTVAAASSQGRELTKEEDAHVLALLTRMRSLEEEIVESSAAPKVKLFPPQHGTERAFSDRALHAHVRWQMQILEFSLRLGAALLVGTVVGLERQWRQRMAGTRTNALAAAGAAAFVMSAFMVRDTSRSEAQIVSYVVSGVGFLGAGVIFKDSGSVRGLNTAATLWCSAAIGAISGLGNPLHALILTAAVLGTNIVLRPLAYLCSAIKSVRRRINELPTNA